MSSAKQRQRYYEKPNQNFYDDLTFALSPHQFYSTALRECHFASRRNHPLTLLIIDVTESSAKVTLMKNALVELAALITAHLRSDEIVARVGFEKFACLLHGSQHNAQSLQRRIEREWRRREIAQRDDIVLSWRIVECPSANFSTSDLSHRDSNQTFPTFPTFPTSPTSPEFPTSITMPRKGLAVENLLLSWCELAGI